MTLRNSVSGQPIDDTEVRRKFQQFGDVKTVKHLGDRPEYVDYLFFCFHDICLKKLVSQRYVEMYDIRVSSGNRIFFPALGQTYAILRQACQEAHDRLRHQGLQDGVMDIVFAWDVPEMPLPPGPLPPSK